MNLKSEIMDAVMQGRADDIRKYLLSPAERELVRSIELGDLKLGDLKTASQLTRSLGITPALANARLKKLFDLEYVKRSREPARSGGMDWVYFT